MASDLAHSIATLPARIVKRPGNTHMPKPHSAKAAHIKKSGSLDKGDVESLDASERGVADVGDP